MISAAEALKAVLERVPVLGTVTLSVRRAGGHSLAGKVSAPVNVPQFDNSAMDGYAVMGSDLGTVPVTLRVVGETAAGAVPGERLQPGEARRIMTGAPIPGGADTVVPRELTREPGEGARGHVRILDRVETGAHIRRAGSDIPKNSVVLGKGQLLRPFELGVLASMGIGFVTVHRHPSVCLIPTGDELVGPGVTPGPGKIHESNSTAVGSMLEAEGCEIADAGIIADDPAALAPAITEGLHRDMLVTMGGVSAGKYDAMPRLFAGAGVEPVFHRVNIKPGMPLWFGMKGDVPVFGLPGNPVSAVVTFTQFVRPAIRKMSGRADPAGRMTLRAQLETDIEKKDGRRHFMRGILQNSVEGPTVRPAGTQHSHAASVLARANCLIVLPEEQGLFGKGDPVEVELL